MYLKYAISRSVAVVSTILLLVIATGCSKVSGQGGVAAAPAAASQGKAASKLGDLSAFRSTAAGVADVVEKGDLPFAKALVIDLEVAWDAAAAGMKPQAADDWRALDMAIHKVLATLRADRPIPADCKAAMANLLRTFDTLEGKA